MRHESLITIPWNDCEMFEIDGVKCTYSRAFDDELVIHFPGQVSVKLTECEASRAIIKYPSIWRSPIERLHMRKIV